MKQDIFDDYPFKFPSRSEAWEHCQDIDWMFVMLDESGYSQSPFQQQALRQFACQLARHYWHLIFHPDLRAAVEVTENFVSGQAPGWKLLDAKGLARSARRNSTKTGSPVYLAAKLAESCTFARADVAAASAIKYALKLGATESALTDNLRDVVGNPYLLLLDLNTWHYWWSAKPGPNTPLNWLKQRLQAQWSPDLARRVEFYNFLSKYGSLREAWECCQNPEWMFAMLDLFTDYAETSAGQVQLRRFACCCATEDRVFQSENAEECIRQAVQTAQQFAGGQATRKQLKQAELELGEAIEIRAIRGLYGVTALIAEACTAPSAWVAALSAGNTLAFYHKERFHPLQVLKLRELMGNPFAERLPITRH